jgi:hypothetical protein
MNYTPLVLLALNMFGILIHNLMKMDEINKKSNGNFKLMQYLKLERFSIAVSICFGIVCVIASQEIKQLEQVGKWLGLAFVAIGYMAQSIIIKFGGKAEKFIDNTTKD